MFLKNSTRDTEVPGEKTARQAADRVVFAFMSMIMSKNFIIERLW
jgi:hypothetical protein